jgi:enoyl-CoA hydratase/carnithine racemase
MVGWSIRRWLQPYSKPIIAVVTGDCVAGGLELLSTDIGRQYRMPALGFPKRAGPFILWRRHVKLREQIGHVHAMELLLTARLSPPRSGTHRLVNRLPFVDELMPWATATAETIAANSPTAVQAVKRQITGKHQSSAHAQGREALDQNL